MRFRVFAGAAVGAAMVVAMPATGKAPRKGKAVALSAVLGQRDTAKLAAEDGREPQAEAAGKALGMSLRPLTAEEAQALGMKAGTGLGVTGLEDGSAAAEAGLRPGDVILEVNQNPVKPVAEFSTVIEQDARGKGVALLLVKRGKQNLFVPVPVGEGK